MTVAEQRLWRAIRDEQLEGWKFRRQYPAGAYVLDFVCLQAKLVVEVDGGQHADRVEYDEKRTTWLKQQGFTVVRFWNNEVMGNLAGVLETIVGALGKQPPSPPSPCTRKGYAAGYPAPMAPPSRSKQGEGAGQR